jgi:hypothetical protein
MYCELSENCKLLKQNIAQYDSVVKQNKELQCDLRVAEMAILKYRKSTFMLMQTIYKNFGELFSEGLKREVEEFLLTEKDKLC